MSKQNRYLVTTNADTGEIESVQQLGSSGELIPVDPRTLLAAGFASAPAPETAPHTRAPGVFLSPELPGVFISPELPH